MQEQQYTLGLVHGSWHGAWCWALLQPELEEQGFNTVAVDLPTEDPEATFDDHAAVAAEAFKNEENLILVGHSRAGNIIPRVAGMLAVEKLIYLAASFEPATIQRPLPYETVPSRNDLKFHTGITRINNNLTVFDRELSKELFYHDCSPAVQDWASWQLRPQRRSKDEPRLSAMPNIDSSYIICTQDRVVRPEWSEYAAKHWLKTRPHYIESGHSPFFSKPRELAKMVLDIVQENTVAKV